MTGWRPWRPWRHLFRRDLSRELDDEFAYHLEERIREYVSRGMDPVTARARALERLGDVDVAKRECVALPLRSQTYGGEGSLRRDCEAYGPSSDWSTSCALGLCERRRSDCSSW
jgi:hypothetical protein